MRLSYTLTVALLVLMTGCQHPPAAPSGPSPALQAADADVSTPPAQALPRLVDAALASTPYAGRVQSSAMTLTGTKEVHSMLLRVHVVPAPGTIDAPEALQLEAHRQLVDVLSILEVPLTHRQIHHVICQIVVPGPTGPEPGVAVEMADFSPSAVPITGLNLGDVVPADKINAKVHRLQSNWDRLKHPSPSP